MIEQTMLETERLRLRKFEISDAEEVQRLAGDRDVAATTLSIPHPYPDGAAEKWIESHAEALASGANVVYAIVSRSRDQLIGTINLAICEEHQRAEMGYWIGKPFWGQGYCTEAAKALLRFGFESLGLHRIYAHYMSMNPASGRVMEKMGMTYEGRLRLHIEKGGKHYDVIAYGILRSEFESTAG